MGRESVQSRAVRRGNRTKRMNARLKPVEVLEEAVRELLRRVDEGELEENTARVLILGHTLLKDLHLARLRTIEVDRRLEESDVREEFEELKRELGVT